MSNNDVQTGAVWQTRFHYEFWILCLIVSLGFIQSFEIGFYKFRLNDLILILSSVYFLRLLGQGRVEPKIRLLLFLYFVALIVRCYFEFEKSSAEGTLRTLIGMYAIQLAPVIFFLCRESRISRNGAVGLLIVAWVVSLLSQLGLLSRGESYVSGLVNLGSIIGIESRAVFFELDYTEATITVWRALSVGVTFGLLVANTNLWQKLIGMLFFILQFGGGGGGRSALLFIFIIPIALVFLRGSFPITFKIKKILAACAWGSILIALYLWGPFSQTTGKVDAIGFGQTHFERASEFLLLFTEGFGVLNETTVFNARGLTYQFYLQNILSDPQIFFFGTGVSHGFAFQDQYNILAHNMILDVWGITGLIGLIFLSCFMWYVIRDMWKLLKIEPQETKRELILLSFAAAVIFMFQWLLFQAATADRSFMIVFYLLAGLLKPTMIWLQGNNIASQESKS